MPTVRVADLLSLVADEVERVRVLGLRVEDAILQLTTRSAVDRQIVAELQHLDAILQQLGAIRDFTGQVSLSSDLSHRVDVRTALERITLADVRSRLSGDSDEEREEGWQLL